MQPSVIVWDLETVPDLGGFAAANDLVGKSDVEIREAIGEKFPKFEIPGLQAWASHTGKVRRKLAACANFERCCYDQL
jgi:hypothetical protein